MTVTIEFGYIAIAVATIVAARIGSRAYRARTNAEIDARILPQARAGNTEPWNDAKLKRWSGTQEEYDARDKSIDPVGTEYLIHNSRRKSGAGSTFASKSGPGQGAR